MKRLYTIFLFIALFGAGFSGVYAQNTQPTPYQKKQLELSKKYFQILYGYKMSMADNYFYEQLASGKDASDFLLGLGILNYAMTHSKEQFKMVITQMNNEFKQAEKLKNATDFRLEKEAKARAEQEAKEQKLRKEREAYESTDAGIIEKNIKDAFEKWNQKGEFEKEADYAERLKTQSKTIFDEICIKQIKDEINYWNNLGKDLSTYDTSDETFTISFKMNSLQWQNRIKVPVDIAKNFKNNFYDLQDEINNYDWCFVENSLCPTLVTIESRKDNLKYKLPVPFTNQKDIAYYFDDLEINNQYLKGYAFNYSAIKSDSLVFISYNQKLDSVCNNYNRQLLQNPHNADKLQLNKPNAIQKGSNYQEQYNKIVENLAIMFKEKTTEIEEIFEQNTLYNQYKMYFPDKSAFVKQYNEIGKESMIKKAQEAKTEYEKERENLYQQYAKYYPNKSEFEAIYDRTGRGNAIITYLQQEVDKQDFETFKQLIEEIKSANLQNKKDKNGISVIQAVAKFKGRNVYSKVIQFIIANNKQVNTKWEKEGQYFNFNKVEFYEAYISGNYNQILKEKKKK